MDEGGGPIGGTGMDELRDYFECDRCSNREFKVVYSFSLRFHGVNFSDELIYDRLVDERFQCTKCDRTLSRGDIEKGLSEIRNRRRGRP